ncbi:MAG: MFS transporter [Actinobacteria bacterium 69-20]|nr:DHA2 family efflux MFS transporter permease subunit [Actinomycetota bacterium]OJV31316.1 MAG: MFS transporter [Actinobacteria bacterium 69-20]
MESTTAQAHGTRSAWAALWALCLGFFMILVDSTIVSVAIPTMMVSLHASINEVLWVTSAYLLAYAVPLLITGRLGDRFGPKALYQTGLVIFTASSAWCGLSGSIGMLVTARVFQGLGASMMTPQTMTVVTRTFPANRRGTAMGMWGAVAGVATLVGPILGGVLIDSLGWQWIFFINVPVGIVGLGLAMKLVPHLEIHSHRFDVTGVALSAVGMFLLVFGIQEGETYHWGTIAGPISVWSLIIAGAVVLAAFVLWQAKNAAEPLVPLPLFKDRNFSLANIGIAAVGFTITALSFPLMLYAQKVLGLSPVRSALLMVPMAIITGGLAKPVGNLVDRTHPRYLGGFGLACMITSLVWLWQIMAPGRAIWQLELPIALIGVANAFMWSPISATATRNLPMHAAGAGSGVYNTTRQVGAVLGSAGIAVVMQSRLAAAFGASAAAGSSYDASGALPAFVQPGFARAMGESLLLPAAILLIGLVAVLFFARPEQTMAPHRLRAGRHAQPVAAAETATAAEDS